MYGVSPDKPSAQKKFKEKYELPYSLLADVDKDLAKKFDVSWKWEGNTLQFQRSGVDGFIKLTAKQVHVVVNLGFLLSMLKAPVEKEINRYLDEGFG